MFRALELLPEDPILGMMSLFRDDPRPQKVDLGVGVYKDEHGHTPVLPSIKIAEQRVLQHQSSKVYVGPAGREAFNEALLQLVLGQSPSLPEGRVAAVQTPGGCGALRVAAELVNVVNPGATIWVSDPTWGNHIPLLGNCGLQIKTYPYFDSSRSRVKFDAMMECLAQVKAGELVLLHGSCHNPSGADLTLQQWQQVAQLAAKNGFTPFVDVAYQGFGDGIEQDVAGLRHLVAQLPEVIVAVSCSKNFGLYRERVGQALIVCATGASASAARSHMMSIVRGIYSMPPDHGAALVATVLNEPVLKTAWVQEVADMRSRINGLRAAFSQAMYDRLGHNHFDFVQEQKGMFSFLGITQQQVMELRQQYAIYLLDSSRASISGLNYGNLDYVCDAMAAVHEPMGLETVC